ncbi:phenylacetate--CoA ligase [Methylomonas sp. LWB]|nr:phenylacetate--CoA ligase [Methylomonas sp. LWB]
MTDLNAVFQRFLTTPLDDLLGGQDVKPEEKLLALFRRCAAEVPAYRQFLAERGVSPEQVVDYAEYSRLPLMSKQDYMRAYPLAQRCFGGSLAGADRVAVSSGSTGQPTFWPRSAADELDVALRFEQVFKDSFAADRRTTLAVVCFALGNWVGGLFTTSCCWHLARKGYRLMVATPGNNKAEIFRVVRELAPQFEQTVLLGYPPFIKDVIDAGNAEGIVWSDFNPKLVFAGEVFSEEWRALVGERIGAERAAFDSASLYGTADGGVLGNETPLSIAIRRWLARHPDEARAWFGESRLPTLVQYDPASRFFEVEADTLVVSGENSVPLVRYHIADKGGVIPYRQIWERLRAAGIETVTDLGLPSDFKPRELPFVFVFGRADFTVSYYGANIYPENVTVGLEQPELTGWLTGKFVLQVRENVAGDSELQVAVEVLPDVDPEHVDAGRVAESIKVQLLRLNSEFAHYAPAERQTPMVTLHRFADPEYFPAGVKHRYTRN